MNVWTNLQIDRICRVCLNENNEMTQLFEECLAERLKELTTLQVSDELRFYFPNKFGFPDSGKRRSFQLTL
jgi:hypothetical protein